MNPKFTRFQKLPFVADPPAPEQPATMPETAHGAPQGPGVRQPSAAFLPVAGGAGVAQNIGASPKVTIRSRI